MHLGLTTAEVLLGSWPAAPDNWPLLSDPHADQAGRPRRALPTLEPTKEELFDLIVDEVYAGILPEKPPGDWREALRGLAHRTRGPPWVACGRRPARRPAQAGAGRPRRHRHRPAHRGDRQRVRHRRDRREVAHLGAEHDTGPSGRVWQRASRPHVTRMLAMGRFPALAGFVYDATKVDAETSLTAGLEWFLDGAARL